MGDNILSPTQQIAASTAISAPAATSNACKTRLRIFKGKVLVERAPRHKADSLRDYKNISKEVLEILREHGLKDVPSASFFKEIGRRDIVSAANVYFDGVPSLRAEMIENGDLKPDFFNGESREWRTPRDAEHSLEHYEIISREVLEILREHGLKDVPSASFFREIGRLDIVSGANAHHGRIPGLRAKMIENGDLKPEC